MLKFEDLVALSKYNPQTNILEIKNRTVIQNPETYSRLIDSKIIDKAGKLTVLGIKQAETVIATETKLKKGIPITERKKSDIGGINSNDNKWIHKKIKDGEKDIEVTACGACIYKGKPIMSTIKKVSFTDKSILDNLSPKLKLERLVPHKYQISSLDGIKVIWFKLKSDYVAIQSCYYDLIVDLFKDDEFLFYGTGEMESVYVKIGNEVVAVLAPFNTAGKMICSE